MAEYHKSLKPNASLAKSPTRSERTQTAHLFASLLAYVKLERLKFVHQMNHFAVENENIFCGSKTRIEGNEKYEKLWGQRKIS